MEATVGPHSVPPCITHTFDRVLRTYRLAVMPGVDHVSPRHCSEYTLANPARTTVGSLQTRQNGPDFATTTTF